MRKASDTGKAVWLFGYGSLIWRQGFPYEEARRAHIRGWERRFWQGSHDHRGVQDDPGRVVTLIKSGDGHCYGRAFLVAADVFEYLDEREINGYRREEVEVYFDEDRVMGITYRAPIENFAFLGEAPIDEMVAQITRCAGRSGRNADYVLELARALRALGASDPHVFELEEQIMKTKGSLLAEMSQR